MTEAEFLGEHDEGVQLRERKVRMTGFDCTAMAISEDVVEQAEPCLRTIEAALSEAKHAFADPPRCSCAGSPTPV
ncbi:hypothetical protein [Streptomyces sp. NRRL B-24572]|uniref:hypothetical protein n=1 Tax=Streptomyces sp. NRRL B-24572 TaxID=1962156 RepID=UPI00358E1521